MSEVKAVVEIDWRKMSLVELAKSNIKFARTSVNTNELFSPEVKKTMMNAYASDASLIDSGDQDTIEFYAVLEKKRQEELEKNKK